MVSTGITEDKQSNRPEGVGSGGGRGAAQRALPGGVEKILVGV